MGYLSLQPVNIGGLLGEQRKKKKRMVVTTVTTKIMAAKIYSLLCSRH